VKFLGEEHLPFAITSCFIIRFTFLPPLLLIFYPCKVFNKYCCHNRRCNALHIFFEAFQGCYKDGVTRGRDLRSISRVYLLFRFLLLMANYPIGNVMGWLLRALMFLSLSMLILIVQPYKKSYMNVLDGLLLALLGLVTLLLVTFHYLHNIIRDANEMLALIFAIICSFPQFILLLSVTYRQRKERE